MCLLYPTQSTCWNIVNLYWKNRCCCLRLLEIRMDLFQSYMNLFWQSFIAIYSHYFKGQFLKKFPYVMIGKLILYKGQICLCATYSAGQLQSAVRGDFFQNSPLKYCESVHMMPKAYFLVNVQFKNVVTFTSRPKSSKSFRRGMTWQNAKPVST